MEGQDTIDSRALNLNHELEEEEHVQTTLAVAEVELKARAAAAAEMEKARAASATQMEKARAAAAIEEEYQAEMGPKRIPMHPRLHMAATKGDKHLLEQLLKSDHAVTYAREGEVTINVTNRASSSLLGVTYAGETALHLAARFGHFELAKIICNKNRSLLTKRNTDFETPLHYAAKAGCHRSVSFFIKLASEEGTNVEKLLREKNKHGETALYQAILYRHATVVEELVKVDPGLAIMADNEHISPLYLAALQGSLPIVTTLVGLLRNNVSQSAYGGPDGQTALHAASLRDIGLLRKMLDWKPELATIVDISSGSTPLHYAASRNLPRPVGVLLEKDISPAYTSDRSGLFPVHVAAKLGHVEVIKGFFERCPDSDKLLDRQGRNFLHLAVEEKREAIVSWACKHSNLIEALNAQDDEGNTPMHLAVKAKNIGIFALLLGNENVHLGITNKNRLTPGDLVNTELFNPGLSWQNANLNIIRNVFSLVECCHSIQRVDHLIGQQNPDPEKEEKRLSGFENIAKSLGIISGLIASAAVSAIFAVSAAYKSDVLAGKSTDGSSLAFKAFILVDSYAFLCTITATVLIVKACLTNLDPTHRRLYLTGSSQLVSMGSKAFMAAFAVGVYVIVTPVSKWLAILISVVCSIVIVLGLPKMPEFLITWALRTRRVSGASSAPLMKSPTIRAFTEYFLILGRKLMFAYFIVIVLLISNSKRISGHASAFVVCALGLTFIYIAGYCPWAHWHLTLYSKFLIGREKKRREKKELREGEKE